MLSEDIFNQKIRILFSKLNQPLSIPLNDKTSVFIYLKREKETVSVSQLRVLFFANFLSKLTGKKYI
jgi:hypothetical protein